MILVIDSAVQIPIKQIQEWGVECCDYPMYVDGNPIPVSMEMSDSEKEEIRLLLKDKKRNVSTSGLREEDLLEIYQRHADEAILSFHMSQNASTATAQMISKIKKEHPELDITFYDSMHLVSGYTIQAKEAAIRFKNGASREELDKFLKEAPLRTKHLGIIYDLFYLSRTGRIGSAKAVMGTAMKIIPILSSTNPPGDLKSIGKVKKTSQAVRKFVEIIEKDRNLWPDSSLKVSICYVGPHKEHAEELAAAVKEENSDADIVVYSTNHSTLPHVGPDYVDIGYTLMD